MPGFQKALKDRLKKGAHNYKKQVFQRITNNTQDEDQDIDNIISKTIKGQ